MRELDGQQHRPACNETEEVGPSLYSCIFMTLFYACWAEGIFGKYHGLGSCPLHPQHLCSGLPIRASVSAAMAFTDLETFLFWAVQG